MSSDGHTGSDGQAMSGEDRYTVISADCHAGADLLDYKPYLEKRHHDAFDAWAATYVNPYEDLLADTADRNWNSERRLAEMEADGIVAEVVFPNTIPPFYPAASLMAPVPTREEFAQRWAGCARTTGGSPTSARSHPDGAPASRRSCSTTSTRPSRKCAGPTRTG